MLHFTICPIILFEQVIYVREKKRKLDGKWSKTENRKGKWPDEQIGNNIEQMNVLKRYKNVTFYVCPIFLFEQLVYVRKKKKKTENQKMEQNGKKETREKGKRTVNTQPCVWKFNETNCDCEIR